jgi:spermidine/putrescine-binding protein
MQEMTDGCWVDWRFDISFDEEEQEQIQALWDEEYFEGLENQGWFVDETEQWIFGPITLRNLDTGEEWHGSE